MTALKLARSSAGRLEVDLTAGKINNVTRKKTFVAESYPDFMMGIINAGGLVEHTRKKLAGGK